jgi:hypothetical protein
MARTLIAFAAARRPKFLNARVAPVRCARQVPWCKLKVAIITEETPESTAGTLTTIVIAPFFAACFRERGVRVARWDAGVW